MYKAILLIILLSTEQHSTEPKFAILMNLPFFHRLLLLFFQASEPFEFTLLDLFAIRRITFAGLGLAIMIKE